jgi:DNA polymerase
MSEGLHIDLESKSDVDLPKRNAYVYWDSPYTDVWCGGFAFGSAEPELWVPGEPCPPAVKEHVFYGGLVYGWNVNFERLGWNAVLGPRYGWPVPKLEQYRCVMAAAYAVGLPGKLENAAGALGLEERKDADGYRVMLQLSKPRRPRKGEDPNGVYWWDDPEKLKRLFEYNLQDVRTERAIHCRIPPLRSQEQEYWFMDARMNDRGVFIDEKLCRAAQEVVASASKRLNKEMTEVTDWAVRGVSNVAELIAFIKKHGLDADSVAKDQILELLVRDDLAPSVRRALEIRQEGSKTSTAKIDAMLVRRQSDGRMRGNLQFNGANTGRWAARGAQLQNLPRPNLSKLVPGIIDDLLAGTTDEMISLLYGPSLSAVSDCIRGMVVASPGNKLIAADFSQIEARVVAWLAGEQQKLDAFAAYDRKEGPDIYTVEAAGIYVVSPSTITKDDPRRQVGKVGTLSLGFQGGPGAFAKMAKNYNVDIADAYETVMASASRFNLDKAEDGWDQRGKRSGMSERAWMTAELIKLAWRQANPNIEQHWHDTEYAAISAVMEPGTAHSAGKVTYKKAGSWLFCQLPSKRCLAYTYPKIVEKETPWGAKQPGLVFWGVDSFTKKWSKQDFYGGLGVQNNTQAVARDVMIEAMARGETAGYSPVLTVHDEGVCEVPQNFGTVSAFCQLMVQQPSWADGLPIAADGWEGSRYRK